METDLVALLKTLCPRVQPMTADLSTARPFVTYQHIGGQSLRYMDNTAADKRWTLIQINVWAGTSAEGLTLIRAIEEALCASNAFTAEPQGEPIAEHEPELRLYGFMQDFSVLADR
jgi:hypothetical protein